MKYIYLDQNKWIDFEIGYNKGEGEVYDFVVRLKEKIERGEIRIVVSLVNINEMRKIANEDRRNKLLDFMIDLSQGYAISPFVDWITDMEIRNLFFKRIEKPIDIRSMVIDKWISIITGARPKIVGDISDEREKEIIDYINSSQNLKKIFSSSKTHVKESQDSLIEGTKKIEEARRNERTIKDKTRQYKIVMARFFEDFIFMKMAKVGSSYNFPKDFIFKEGMGMKEIIEIFQELPATYVYFSLNDMRDRDLSKMIEVNDLNDLFSFTMGIAYCDILFGEKRFVSLAKQSKLDKIYGRVITSSFEEFKKAIS